METAHASHAVVDERDGMTWVKDGDGHLMDQARAEALAGKWNDACKTEHQTYAVYRLELVTPAPAGVAQAPCPLPDTAYYRRMAAGHRTRTGHDLDAVLAAGPGGISRLERTCCPASAEEDGRR